MKTLEIKHAISIFIVTTSILASCGPAPRLALTGEAWSNKHEYEVKGTHKFLSKQTLSIADIQSTSVSRSWTRTATGLSGFGFGTPGQSNWENIISTEYINRNQSLRFGMHDGGRNKSDVYCLANVKREDLIIGRKNGVINTIFDIAGIGDSESNLFAVQLIVNDIQQPFELLLDNRAAQKSATKYVGQIVQGKEVKYTIVPLNQLMGKNNKPVSIPFGSVGFEIKNTSGNPVAAISIMGKPVVYFNNVDEKEKFLLANIAAAILLREVI